MTAEKQRRINTVTNKKPGRPRGAKNKISGTAKENVAAVFTRLGGTAQMAKWANDNQTEFYKLYGRLIPVESQVGGPGGGPVQHKVTITVD
jgi:hypothetical protein